MASHDDTARGRRRRYSRQEILPDIGQAGIERLAASHAAVVGVGALGSMSSELLARAGVGRLTVIDRDVVDWTNLQRQVLFTEADAAAGAAKADAAERALRDINSDITIKALIGDAAFDTVESMLGFTHDRDTPRPDVIVDGADNFETRLLLNDIAVKHGVPYVYGGAIGTRGMLMTVLPAGHADASWAEAAGPCLRCVLGDAPAPGESETCDTAGVLGPVTSAVASFQAVEALKVLLGRFDKLRRHLLAFDPWNTEFARVDAGPSRQSPRCPCCAERRFEHLDGATMRETTVLCGSGERGAVQLRGGGRANPADLAKRFRNAGLVDVRATPIFARAVIAASAAAQDGPAPIRGDGKSDPSKRPDADAHPADDDPAHADIELTVFADGRAIFRGLGDAARAKALYARFVGG